MLFLVLILGFVTFNLSIFHNDCFVLILEFFLQLVFIITPAQSDDAIINVILLCFHFVCSICVYICVDFDVEFLPFYLFPVT